MYYFVLFNLNFEFSEAVVVSSQMAVVSIPQNRNILSGVQMTVILFLNVLFEVQLYIIFKCLQSKNHEMCALVFII